MMIVLYVCAALGVVFALLLLLILFAEIEIMVDRWRRHWETYRKVAADDFAMLRESLRLMYEHWWAVRRLLREAEKRRDDTTD
ncbi:hypothetical protein [Amycolatopsis sp. CA-126428]|uniref:hypothetical protein n=1 Tax=Amycolatopsis sp. CA-126428 TaxID=2073158 RepID=UPI000CD280A5|nr:hypothetical protein [Amycolatopsis sp. CA-126428]